MKKQMFGITEEHESGGTLWFDLDTPEILVNYLKSNVDLGEEKGFILKEMSSEEIAQLEE